MASSGDWGSPPIPALHLTGAAMLVSRGTMLLQAAPASELGRSADVNTRAPMMLKVFFADYCEDKVLESKDARVATQDELLHSMDCVLHMPRNFIGVIDENGVTLQFMVNDDRTIHVDLPVPAKRGSYVKTAHLSECLNMVRRIGDSIKMDEIDGMAFQAW
jgi:hypothetical protein